MKGASSSTGSVYSDSILYTCVCLGDDATTAEMIRSLAGVAVSLRQQMRGDLFVLTTQPAVASLLLVASTTVRGWALVAL